jgi:hypothetical protein
LTPPTTAGNDDRRARAGRKVAEAMAQSGQARIDLLREALQLDPDNGAVQNLLASAVAPAPEVVTPTAASPSAPPAAAPSAAPRGPSHGKPKQEGDESGIRRVIVD